METSFEEISNEILTGLMELNPAYARNIGLHEFDGEMPSVGKTALEAAATWAKAELERLNSFDQTSLNEQRRCWRTTWKLFLSITTKCATGNKTRSIIAPS